MELSAIFFPIAVIGGMGILFGLLLGIIGEIFKVETDPKIAAVREALPGANCAGCGFAGCDALAEAIAAGNANPGSCPVGGADTTVRIAEIMGLHVNKTEKMCAFVKCGGNLKTAESKYDYEGIDDCLAAATLAGGGSKTCGYGCFGNGSCLKACKFEAISISDGLAIVDNEKCTACGRCIMKCPRNLIELVPYKSKVRVNCNSADKGKDVMAYCASGCIGCGICQKICGQGAIQINAGLAEIDYGKCSGCGECVGKCPAGCISGH